MQIHQEIFWSKFSFIAIEVQILQKHLFFVVVFCIFFNGKLQTTAIKMYLFYFILYIFNLQPLNCCNPRGIYFLGSIQENDFHKRLTMMCLNKVVARVHWNICIFLCRSIALKMLCIFQHIMSAMYKKKYSWKFPLNFYWKFICWKTFSRYLFFALLFTI